MATASVTAETKREAIKMVEAGQAQADVARTLGVNRATVHKWVRRAKGRAVSGSPDAPAVPGSPAVLAASAPSDEVTALRARVRDLESRLAASERRLAVMREAVVIVGEGAAR